MPVFGLKEELSQEKRISMSLVTQLDVNLLFGIVPQLAKQINDLVHCERVLMSQSTLLDLFERGLYRSDTQRSL